MYELPQTALSLVIQRYHLLDVHDVVIDKVHHVAVRLVRVVYRDLRVVLVPAPVFLPGKVVPVETAVGLLREFRVKIHELPVVPLDPAHVTRLLDLARYLRVLYDVGHLVGDYLPAEPPVERYRVGIQQRKRAVVLTHAGEALYHKALHNAVTSVLRVCANAGHESNRVLHVVDVHFQWVNGELRHKVVAVKAAEHVRALEHRELRALYLVVLPAGLGKLLLRDLECVSQQCVVLVDIVNRQRSDCIV